MSAEALPSLCALRRKLPLRSSLEILTGCFGDYLGCRRQNEYEQNQVNLLALESEDLSWTVAQSIECLPGIHNALGLNLGMIVHTRHPSSQEVEEEGSRFKVVLDYIKNWRPACAT